MKSDNPFETIESAHEFVKLLTKAICEAKRELETHVEKESADASRRLDALRIVLYSLGKLESHMHQSSRILNDLRSLRRLLLAERGSQSQVTQSDFASVTDETVPAEELDAADAGSA